MNRARHGRWVVVALALASACAKDKTTALEVKLTVTGDLDQVSIDAIQLGTKTLDLTGEQTLFPMPARKLMATETVTIWFADSADMQPVVVTATGLLCGKIATPPVTTPMTTLAKGQTVQTTLRLVSDLTGCNDGGGGAGGTTGAGGAGGAAGQGGTTGTGGMAGGAGAAGTTGSGGIAGTAGAAGSAGRGGTTGTAGTGGAAGRGGTTGTAGMGGAAGRGGTTGTAGTGGAAGRGGTTGTAGTGGAAGRGGTTGTAGTGGAAGRGGTTGSGGAGATCGTTPRAATAQIGSLMPGATVTYCGYPIGSGGVVQYILPQGSDAWAQGNGVALNMAGIGNANCGRCVQITRTKSGASPPPIVVTLVGSCPDQACQADPNPHFEIGQSTYLMLATANEPSLPANASETLTYSFVPCPVSANQTILANFKIPAGAPPTSVLFLQHRYGIASVTMDDPNTGQPLTLFRSNDSYWTRSDGNPLPTGTAVPTFHLTDVNGSLLNLTNLPPGNTPMFTATGQQFPLLCTP